MAMDLEVEPYDDGGSLNFSSLIIYHRNCGDAQGSQISINRNPATDVFILRCACGLQVEIPQLSEAQSLLTDCAIGQHEATLPADSYSANTDEEIHVAAMEQGDA